jgi:hypothetical protein
MWSVAIDTEERKKTMSVANVAEIGFANFNGVLEAAILNLPFFIDRKHLRSIISAKRANNSPAFQIETSANFKSPIAN